jgi:DNA-binding MarR family transcriptional regulator
MSKTDLSKVVFTPTLDALTEKYGLITSAVFGRIWRYCQMSEGYCHAQQKQIAKQLGISRGPVNRAIKVLVKDGYIEDSTQNKFGRTRIYKDTGKAEKTCAPKAHKLCSESTQAVLLEHTKIVIRKKKKQQQPVVVDSNSNSRAKSKAGSSLKEVLGSGLSASHARKERELEFLSTASDEQKKAYQLAKQVTEIDKAIEKATSAAPMESVIELLKWKVKDSKSKANARIAQTLLAGIDAEIEKNAQQLQPTRQLSREDVIDMNGI